MLPERLHVTDAVDEGCLHVGTYLGASLGNQWNASACHRLQAYEAKSFFDAWKDQNIAASH